MLQIKELVLHDDVILRLTIEDYITKHVELVIQTIQDDMLIETPYILKEPYERFEYLVQGCKKYGQLTKVKK